MPPPYFNVSAKVQPTDSLAFDTGIGFAEVDGDKATGPSGAFCDTATGILCDGYNYTHWTVGATTSIKGFDLDLRYHDTNESASHVAFFGGTDLLDDRFVVTVSRSF